MFRKVSLLEILRSPLLTEVQAYSIEFVRFRKRTPQFLKGALKLTENFQEVISNGFPYQKFTNLQNAAFSLDRF